MPKSLQVALVIVVVFLGGILLGQLTGVRAQAQQPARAWRECFYATLWNHNGAEMGSGAFRPRTVVVPPGWTPIGGGGSASQPVGVVLCR